MGLSSLKEPDQASWKRTLSSRTSLEGRLAGYEAHESQLGTSGPGVPGVRALRLGDQPRFQNAEFDLSTRCRATPSWWSRGNRVASSARSTSSRPASTSRSAPGATGARGMADYPALTRNESDFSGVRRLHLEHGGQRLGGELRLRSCTASTAAFVQDEITIAERVMLSPGVRVSRWSGALNPCADSPTGERCGSRFAAVSAVGVDPRVGVAWDITGHNTFALKAHWGRYHQGMYSLFFDRAAGADASTPTGGFFYYYAPPLSSPTRPSRSANATGRHRRRASPPFFDETILDESGRGYRQPYVDSTKRNHLLYLQEK